MLDVCGRLKYIYIRRLGNKHKSPPDDVTDLFKEYTDNERMHRPKLCEYLEDHQGVARDHTDEYAQNIIASRKLKGFTNCRRNSISINGFFEYLLSSKNHPLLKEEFDGSAKLAHYFVYTSHCSYLKQNRRHNHIQMAAEGLKIKLPSFHQKGGKEESMCKLVSKPSNNNTTDKNEQEKFRNSITAIEKALKNGVRVLELDLWLNSDKSNVIVSHPGTLRQQRSSINLQNCLKTISEKAFVDSEFPLMIILVQHFDSDQSDVSILQHEIKRIDKFSKDNLVCTLKDALDTSLDSLKRKVIILTRQQMRHDPTNTNDKEVYIAGENENPENANNLIQLDNKRIVGYYDYPEIVGILRLTENEVEYDTTHTCTCYTSLTQERLLAVYPSPNPNDPEDFTKNIDPLIGWTRGAQMVAINPQDFDKHLWVMQGLFRAQLDQDSKKPTGYVKKPEILLNNKIFDPTEWRPVKTILKVKVYLGTGWHLDFDSEEKDFESDNSPPDFFTAVEIVGVPADEAREKTVPIMDQWVPVWNQEFKFPLTVPELAMLLIEVKEFDTDRTHDFGGQTCLPVRLLRSGIRSVPLYDKKGKLHKNARLLMRFEFN